MELFSDSDNILCWKLSSSLKSDQTPITYFYSLKKRYSYIMPYVQRLLGFALSSHKSKQLFFPSHESKH